jgi:hypothetical protein
MGRAGRSGGVQQATVADAGSFTVLQGGAKIGREVFTIRRLAPPDVGYLVEGAAVYPTRRLVPVLRTDSSGTPVRYEVEELVADRRQRQLTLQISRGHGSERVQTRQSESATEFKIGPDSRLIDDDLLAQYYFIARMAVRPQPLAEGHVVVVSLLVPRLAGTVAADVSVIGTEHLDIAGQSRAAVHLRIEPAGGPPRDVWADAEGRVLRISIPARGLLVSRDEVPP